MATIQAQIEAERAALEAAKARITPDDEAEIEARAELERLREKRLEIERGQRDLDLQRREDAAREALGNSAKIAPLAIDGYRDTFILVHVPKAYAAYEHTLNSGKKYDRVDVMRRYALASIHDWNGVTDWNQMIDWNGGTTTAGHALAEFLRLNQGVVTPIVNEAARLAGLFAEARKSGR